MLNYNNILKTKEDRIYLFCWLIYALITFFAVINHEPNRDEAQVWLIVRDLNISSIYRELSAMGHPGLWYLILFPFAKLGFPYVSMLIIHWIIGITATALLLFKSDIKWFLKILFLFSYYMLFEYMVPVRNYSLTILLLFSIGACYQSRFSNPIRYGLLIFALFNSNTHSFGAAVGLLLIYIIDGYDAKKLQQIKYALLIMIAGIGAFIFQLWPSLEEVSRNVTTRASLIPALNFNSFWIIVTGIQNAFIPVTSEYEELKVALFFTFIFATFLILLLRYKSVFIFMITSSAWLFYLFSTKLSGSWRHEGLLLIFILFSIWITAFYSNEKNKISIKLSSYFDFNNLNSFFTKFLAACLLINIIFGLKSITKEYKYNYSGAEEVATYIKNNKYESSEIACYRSWRATAIAPYLPNAKLWQIERKTYGTFYDLDSTFYKYGNSLAEKDMIETIKNKYPENCLLLLNEKLLMTDNENYSAKLLFENKEYIWGTEDEYFLLYSLTFKKD